MDTISQAKKRRTNTEIIVKVKSEVVHGKINIDGNIGLGYYFNDDMNKLNFLPVYDSYKQGVGGQTVIINKEKIDWISPNRSSEPLRDCIMPGGYNPVKTTVKLSDNVFVGEINLGYHKRLSDRLNDSHTHFIPLLNVEFRGILRTIFINTDAILSVTDELNTEEEGGIFSEEDRVTEKEFDYTKDIQNGTKLPTNSQGYSPSGLGNFIGRRS